MVWSEVAAEVENALHRVAGTLPGTHADAVVVTLPGGGGIIVRVHCEADRLVSARGFDAAGDTAGAIIGKPEVLMMFLAAYYASSVASDPGCKRYGP